VSYSVPSELTYTTVCVRGIKCGVVLLTQITSPGHTSLSRRVIGLLAMYTITWTSNDTKRHCLDIDSLCIGKLYVTSVTRENYISLQSLGEMYTSLESVGKVPHLAGCIIAMLLYRVHTYSQRTYQLKGRVMLSSKHCLVQYQYSTIM
jgi:hypothetical protein